ncbi:MAG TPA: hypothetical protein VGN22_16375 [Pseudonocardia sp.]
MASGPTVRLLDAELAARAGDPDDELSIDGHELGGWLVDPARGSGGPRAPPGKDET